MQTATNEFRGEVSNQIGYLMMISGSGTLISHDGRNWVAIKATKLGIHDIVTIGNEQLMNASEIKIVDTALLALGYRLTH